MFSRKVLCLTGIAIWVAVIVTASPRPLPHFPISVIPVVPMQSDEAAEKTSCANMHVRFEGDEALYQSEERMIGRSEAATLRVNPDTNGGVRVTGWDGDKYAVTLCKFAEPGKDAQSVFESIHLRFDNGVLSVTGPAGHGHWAAHLLIRAPKNASMDLRTNNGPLAVDHVDGNLLVHTNNGPVTVSRCTGELNLTAENGPVTLDENGGKQKVDIENGPLTVSLALPGWNGEGLEVHAENGPLTLRVPRGYTSGVSLETDGNGPFSCGGVMCSGGRKTWDEEKKRVEYGPSPSAVRISAMNGPVTVR